MKQKYILGIVLVAVIGAAFIYLNLRGENTAPSDSTANTLSEKIAKQSVLKKFSSPEEMKAFFADRSGASATSMSLNRSESMAFGLGSGSKDTAQPTAGFGGGGGFSATNIQVAGVDEADIVKTDGNFIYLVTGKNLVIASSLDPKEAAIVSTTVLASRPQEIYVSGDKLVVFGFDESVYANDGRAMIYPINPRVFLMVYDISDRAAPKVLKSLSFEGNYTASRLIGQRLYFITTTYNYYPFDDSAIEKLMSSGDVFYIDTPSAYNATTVSLIKLDELEEAPAASIYLMPAGENVYASTENLYLTYTKYLSDYELRMTVAREMMFGRLSDRERSRINQINSIDGAILSDDEKAAKINQVIESYINRLPDAQRDGILNELNQEFTRRYEALYKELEMTVVHKIAFDGDKVAYRGSGEVSGRILNQFSMDEFEGNFRIATTRGQSFFMPFPIIVEKMIALPSEQRPSYNNVFVLDSEMKQIGALENLAQGERIYSARFMGKRAYVVTFKQTDPLFVIDLSDARSPRVAGELKIPGFSSYLHPYNETVLIGVGKEAEDRGDQGVDTKGLKISLFDVADMSAPKEIANLQIGGRGSDSSVLYDHKAFLFSAEKNLLVIPATLTAPNSTNYNVEFQGAIVLRVSPTEVSERGRIGHDSTISIQRSLYVGDTLYTLSPNFIQSNSLDSLAIIKKIALPAEAMPENKPMPVDLPLSR
jgi:uncharacterized secreted protein with C-terminal beta-propeller domain